MPTPTAAVGRQFDDVFTKIASGYTIASPTAIANGATSTVAITIPGVALDGTWEAFVETTSATNLNVAGVNLFATVTAANTVTMTILNNSGGSITPTASSKYIAVLGKLNPRFADTPLS